MDIKLLTEQDTDMVRQFYNSLNTHVFNERINKFEIFSDTYLSRLHNYKAYASIDDGITSIVGFYESVDYPEWFVTYMMYENQNHLSLVVDDAIDYNERKGKLRFFSLVDEKYRNDYNSIILSNKQQERYGWFDDFVVKSKNKCIHIVPWQALYFRTLVNGDTIVRCNFLKQEYRKDIPNGGNI
jgi:hypothetical protein